MFLLHVCLPIRLQAFQGQRLPDSLFAPLVPGRALEPSACSMQASLNKYAECGGAEKLCFCSRCPLGTHLSPTLPCIHPKSERTAAPFIYSQQRTCTYCWSKVFGEGTSGPWKSSPAFFPFSWFDWRRLRGTCWVFMPSGSISFKSAATVAGAEDGLSASPRLNNKSMTWNLMKLRGLPDVDLE